MFKCKYSLLFVVFCLVLFAICLNIMFVNAEQYVLKFGHDYMPDSPHNRAALKFKEIVEERTNGNVKVEVYPAQQSFTEASISEEPSAVVPHAGICAGAVR